jgi:hypothetical protein
MKYSGAALVPDPRVPATCPASTVFFAEGSCFFKLPALTTFDDAFLQCQAQNATLGGYFYDCTQQMFDQWAQVCTIIVYGVYVQQFQSQPAGLEVWTSHGKRGQDYLLLSSNGCKRYYYNWEFDMNGTALFPDGNNYPFYYKRDTKVALHILTCNIPYELQEFHTDAVPSDTKTTLCMISETPSTCSPVCENGGTCIAMMTNVSHITVQL